MNTLSVGVLTTMLIAGLSSAAPQDAPRMPTKLLPLEGTLPLPVVDGAITQVGKNVVLVGGMTADFKATPAVQLRGPNGQWKPVGNQLREPRIRPTITALPDQRVFVWGGFGGSADGELTPLHNGEILNPRVAGSAQLVTPPANANWETPSAPVLLNDGAIALIADNALQRFDPSTMTWRKPVPLGALLAGASLCAPSTTELIACGTDPDDQSLRVFTIDLETNVVTPWSDTLDQRILGAQLFSMPDDIVIGLGWPADQGTIAHQTFELNVKEQSIALGQEFPVGTQGATWLSACQVGDNIVVMMTVRKEHEGKDESIAWLLQSNRGGRFRVWELSPLPPGRRQTLLAHGPKSIELIGGYQFLPTGAKLTDTSALLEYGTGPIGD